MKITKQRMDEQLQDILSRPPPNENATPHDRLIQAARYGLARGVIDHALYVELTSSPPTRATLSKVEHLFGEAVKNYLALDDDMNQTSASGSVPTREAFLGNDTLRDQANDLAYLRTWALRSAKQGGSALYATWLTLVGPPATITTQPLASISGSIGAETLLGK